MEDRIETRYVLFHFLISIFVFMTFFGNYMVRNNNPIAQFKPELFKCRNFTLFSDLKKGCHAKNHTAFECTLFRVGQGAGRGVVWSLAQQRVLCRARKTRECPYWQAIYIPQWYNNLCYNLTTFICLHRGYHWWRHTVACFIFLLLWRRVDWFWKEGETWLLHMIIS